MVVDRVGTGRLGVDRVGTDRVGVDRVGTDRVGVDLVGVCRVGVDLVGVCRVREGVARRMEPDLLGVDRVECPLRRCAAAAESRVMQASAASREIVTSRRIAESPRVEPRASARRIPRSGNAL